MKTILQSNSPVTQAGKFRHRISIVQPNAIQDTAGGVSLAYTIVVTQCWGTIESTGGSEKFAASQLVSNSTHTVIIRYFDGIDASMQVVFGSRKFQITNVSDPDERKRVLVLTCVEVNDSQEQ